MAEPTETTIVYSPEEQERIRIMTDGFLAGVRELGEQGAECTCSHCSSALSCPSAFDLYNTNGDCLESK